MYDTIVDQKTPEKKNYEFPPNPDKCKVEELP